MKILFGIALITATFALVSCGDGGPGGSSSPGDVIKTYIESIANEDYDTIIALCVNKKGEELTKEEQDKLKAFFPKIKEEIDKKGGLKEVIILKETISVDGATATVKGKVVMGNGDIGDESDSKLINVNGEWKVIFALDVKTN